VVDAPQSAKKTTGRPRFSAFAGLGASSIAGGARPPAEHCVFGIGQMLDTRIANTQQVEGLSGPPSADGSLPAIVVKAQEDARSRQALARLGYARVRSEYVRHRRDRKETFASLGQESLWPSTDFVRDWLKEERHRKVMRARGPFLMAMLVTIVAGLAFAAVAAILS
jgi:hypothetical protein